MEKGPRAEGPKSAVAIAPLTRRPRWTPTSTPSAPRFMSPPTISCPAGRATASARSPMPSWSPWPSPRPSWASPLTGALSPWLESAWATCSPASPARPATTSAAGRSPRRSTGWPASSRPAARAMATTWCCWTPPRSSAVARSRPCGARALATGPAMAGAAATAASSGACACTLSARWMARRGRPSCAGPTAPSARWRSSFFLAPCAAARSWSPTRAMPGGTFDGRWPSGAGPWCGRDAPTSPATGPSWGSSASASSRSSRPSRTCSPWSVTAPAPPRGCGRASAPACWRSPPACGSTTSWSSIQLAGAREAPLDRGHQQRPQAPRRG